MGIFHKLMIIGVGAALAGCQAPPAPNLASARPAAVSGDVPYHWTVGNAPQAHKNMVAVFGKVGLKPGD